MTTRADCMALDEHDPLASLRDQFVLEDGLIYLDGNSLGALPKACAAQLQDVVHTQWGQGLIRSWNTAGWIDLAARVGGNIGTLIGARLGETVVADSTSINLFKVLAAAWQIAQGRDARRIEILSEEANFPTDLYIAQGLQQLTGGRITLRTVPTDAVLPALNTNTAVLMLTHVNYKNGRLWDMATTTAAAHAQGALMVWDLAHSAGALPVDLHAASADFAVGCGYKYLNGGPGAPAFVWMHPRHAQHAQQPLSGWLGHAAPFAFMPDYDPAIGITRFVCGTPPILSLAALQCGVDTVLAAQALGGMTAIRHKSIALTELFIALVQTHCPDTDLHLSSPRNSAQRGSQVSLAHPHAYAVMQALIARKVIGDFRAPDILRFGFAPLYTRYVDVWDAVQTLRDVLHNGQWRAAQFQQRQAVT
jgi:kynureninase